MNACKGVVRDELLSDQNKLSKRVTRCVKGWMDVAGYEAHSLRINQMDFACLYASVTMGLSGCHVNLRPREIALLTGGRSPFRGDAYHVWSGVLVNCKKSDEKFGR